MKAFGTAKKPAVAEPPREGLYECLVNLTNCQGLRLCNTGCGNEREHNAPGLPAARERRRLRDRREREGDRFHAPPRARVSSSRIAISAGNVVRSSRTNSSCSPGRSPRRRSCSRRPELRRKFEDQGIPVGKRFSANVRLTAVRPLQSCAAPHAEPADLPLLFAPRRHRFHHRELVRAPAPSRPPCPASSEDQLGSACSTTPRPSLRRRWSALRRTAAYRSTRRGVRGWRARSGAMIPRRFARDGDARSGVPRFRTPGLLEVVAGTTGLPIRSKGDVQRVIGITSNRLGQLRLGTGHLRRQRPVERSLDFRRGRVDVSRAPVRQPEEHG